MSKFVVGFVFR